MSMFTRVRITNLVLVVSVVVFISCGNKGITTQDVALTSEKKIEKEVKQYQGTRDLSRKVPKNSDLKGIETSPEHINEELNVTSVNEGNITKNENLITLDHSSWNTLLKKYVDTDGNVVYKSFKNDTDTLNQYLRYLAQNTPSNSAKKNERLAYYINLYNAATVKLILDNYPLTSIKDIKDPWGKKLVEIGGQQVSLGHIEHRILRKMSEPRIHFAINCASYSCPKLLGAAFTASKMEVQLQKATREFIQDTTRNQIASNNVQLSNIFKWYKKDFTDKDSSLIDYINSYTKTTIESNAKIKFLKYDWNLNEAK